MKRIGRLGAGVLAVLGVALAGCGERDTGGAEPAGSLQAPGPLPIYVAPDPEGAAPPAGTRVSGGTRGVEEAVIAVLAPDHVGVTTRQDPVLHWFLAEPTDSRIDFTLIDLASGAALVQATLDGPIQPGVHALRLEDHGLRLTPGATYEWVVSLVPDPVRRSRDVTATALVSYRGATPVLQERLRAAAGERAVFAYAEAGVWYDALAVVSDAIEAAPGDPRLRAWRAALLDQVGLPQVAAWDRAAGG
jgi:hypothetical protein